VGIRRNLTVELARQKRELRVLITGIPLRYLLDELELRSGASRRLSACGLLRRTPLYCSEACVRAVTSCLLLTGHRRRSES